ncbi:MAG: aspartate kinase [Patescibacteria group bacterium]
MSLQSTTRPRPAPLEARAKTRVSKQKPDYRLLTGHASNGATKIPTNIVIKFGGTSVATKEAVHAIVAIVKRYRKSRPVVVVSALRGVTEGLLALSKCPKAQLSGRISGLRNIHGKLAADIFSRDIDVAEVMEYVDLQLASTEKVARKGRFNPEAMDKLVSAGEIMSSFIIARTLEIHGISSRQIVSTEIIVTDDNFMQAEFQPKETERNARKILAPLIRRNIVPVVTGFLGSTKNGRTTTLGRGGSDYSASIIGRSLDAKEIQIWTDVDGIFTADPRVVKNARIIENISYREASEMAAFGAKVLHPRTIRPAVEKNIPVRVLNTFNLKAPGTLVSPRRAGTGLKAIAFKKSVALVNVYSDSMLFSRGFLARMFEVFARHQISIDLVSVSEVSVSVTLDNNNGHLDAAVKELGTFSKVGVHKDSFGMISLIGEGIVSTRDIMKDVSARFSEHKIPLRMISMGASDINISLVIPANDVVRAANMVHDEFLK